MCFVHCKTQPTPFSLCSTLQFYCGQTLDPKYLRFATCQHTHIILNLTPYNLAVPLMPAKSSLHLYPALTTDNDVICKYDSPSRYPSGPNSLSFTLIPSVTPLANLSFPTHVPGHFENKYCANPGILFQHHSPQSWHPAICLL